MQARISPIPCPTGRSEDGRFPLEASRVDLAGPFDLFFLDTLFVFLDSLIGEDDDPVSFL